MSDQLENISLINALGESRRGAAEDAARASGQTASILVAMRELKKSKEQIEEENKELCRQLEEKEHLLKEYLAGSEVYRKLYEKFGKRAAQESERGEIREIAVVGNQVAKEMIKSQDITPIEAFYSPVIKEATEGKLPSLPKKRRLT